MLEPRVNSNANQISLVQPRQHVLSQLTPLLAVGTDREMTVAQTTTTTAINGDDEMRRTPGGIVPLPQGAAQRDALKTAGYL